MNNEQELLRELAELEKAQAEAPGWGAAVGARHERIKEIKGQLAAIQRTHAARTMKPSDEEIWEAHRDWYTRRDKTMSVEEIDIFAAGYRAHAARSADADQTCKTCDGAGGYVYSPESGLVTCNVCGGTGKTARSADAPAVGEKTATDWLRETVNRPMSNRELIDYHKQRARKAEAALAQAEARGRADGLREAAEIALEEVAQGDGEIYVLRRASDAILAAIGQPAPAEEGETDLVAFLRAAVQAREVDRDEHCRARVAAEARAADAEKENAQLRAAYGANARTRRRIRRLHQQDESKALTAIRRSYEAARQETRDLQAESARLRQRCEDLEAALRRLTELEYPPSALSVHTITVHQEARRLLASAQQPDGGEK